MADALKATRSNSKREWTKELNLMRKFLVENPNDKIDKLKIDNIKKRFESFNDAHMNYQEVLKIETELESSEKYFNAEFEQYYTILDLVNKVNAIKENKVKMEGAEKTVQPDVFDLINLPRVELQVFTGDPGNYHEFVSAFEQNVDRLCKDSCAKMSLLLQYTSGPAKEAIRGCLLLGEEGYKEARQILATRFGDPHLITEHLIHDLKFGKSLKTPSEVQALADQLKNTQLILNKLNTLNEINSQANVIEILNRLPYFIVSKWKTKALKIKRTSKTYPVFADFVNFVLTVASEMNDPVYGSNYQINNFTKTHKSYSTNTTTLEPKIFSNNATYSQACPKCSAKHYLNQCEGFRKLSVKERIQFVKEKELCFNCFHPEHTYQNCTRSWRCNINNCSKKHNRWLHIDEEPNETEQTENTLDPPKATCGFVKSFSRVALPIVPVILKNKGIEIQTCALLDSGSTQSFCTAKVLKTLNLSGKEINIQLTTLRKCEVPESVNVIDLEIKGSDGINFKLKNVMSRPDLNISIDNLASRCDIMKWPHLRNLNFPTINCNEVSLLIGQDNPGLLMPIEVKAGRSNEPYAVRTVLGWVKNGPIDASSNPRQVTNHFITSDLKLQVEKFWQIESCVDQPLNSISDRKVISLWEDSLTFDGKHYSANIPFKRRPLNLPSNLPMVEGRLASLKRRLMKDPELKAKYTKQIQDNIKNGYAEEVPLSEVDNSKGDVWYLPHHPVIHPHKPGKVRIVFDCSAEYQGTSLNKNVHQGPDWTNKLIAVLQKFRQEPIAFMADIEKMFMQVHVHSGDRDVLRFLWWKKDDPTDIVKHYRMSRHLFGGNWSPSCANFILKRTADDNSHLFDPETIQTVKNNFYVDDCLKSVATEEQAIGQIKELRELLKRGGFELKKWLSNSRNVMKCIPPSDLATSAATLDLNHDLIPTERVLGIVWRTADDSFSFDVNVKQKPSTKRGLLSITSSIYDPLGFLCPFVLIAKLLFQTLCRMNLDWDESIPEEIHKQWLRWLDDLKLLSNFKVPRCLKPLIFINNPFTAQLHHFSDASEKGYGAVSYLVLTTPEGRRHCSFVMAKSKLAPLKLITIPRLELTAAVISSCLDKSIRSSLEYDFIDSVFWTDSTIVLQYLKNEEKRYKTFVANRVCQILENSTANQWRHIPSALNPADKISRGMSTEELLNSKTWLDGPPFLLNDEELWPPDFPLKLEEIPELELKKNCNVYHANIVPSLENLFERCSEWFKLKRLVAWLVRFREFLRERSNSSVNSTINSGLSSNVNSTKCQPSLTVEDLQKAERAIILYIQKTSISEDQLKQRHLQRLNLFTDNDGLIRVGGRLCNSTVTYAMKHPILLPKSHRVVHLLIEDYHKNYGHCGAERILCEIRERFWIVRGRVTVKRIVEQCILCKKQRAKPHVQLMADLPSDRLKQYEPPFSHVGVDFFGPFTIKRGRSEVKRYGCIFTCLTIRAIHLEVCHSLETDSFINALQRFISRRGNPSLIRSDNGTNLVGGMRELKKSIEQWNQNRIEGFLLQKEIKWYFNPPGASHMGGVWERQIRTVRNILNNLLNQQQLNDETLPTLMCIVENIVNNRPLTKLSNDPDDPLPITPNCLILFRTNVLLPPGLFTERDRYRRSWRQIQYLADVFWRRWVKEYLPTLQVRQKWTNVITNLKPNDLILIFKENTPRNSWPLGIIQEVYPGKDKLVRTVKVKTKDGVYVRPVTKICLLERNFH